MDACVCQAAAEHAETFMDLARSAAHWQFELFLELLTGLVGAALWPLIRPFVHRCCACLPKGIRPGGAR